MAILTRANEICEPLDGSLLAGHAKSLRQSSASRQQLTRCRHRPGNKMRGDGNAETSHNSL